VTVSIASRPSAFLPIVPTAHIDIVGVANSESAGDLCVAGPTGYGVRLLVDLAEGMC
jgi:leucyl aminopeptidase